MYLTRIEIRNFKSISGRQVINLSKGLNVLTGRNGSGKCIAPWTTIGRPWGEVTVESFFKELFSEGLRIKSMYEEYIIPRKNELLISYHRPSEKRIEANVNVIFRKPYNGWLLKIETVSGRRIEVTPEHKLLVGLENGAQEWTRASQLSAGMKVIVVDDGRKSFDILDRIVKRFWRGEVYDIYIENIGSYVTGDGIVVHNSNLIDAIRFALGENNPRLLRTDKLSSLVNDNASRESEAYVKITIDNSDLTMPSQEKLITITRKMGRDGESVYYLNGKRTFKNIIESMISSIGLSARGYNIVLQGEISRLADKNPLERRKEIEQALGLTQYDEKKAEALNNLQQADNNLRVAQARLQEIDRRMLQLEKERNILLRRRLLLKEIEKMQMIIDSLEYWRLVRRLEETSRSLDENAVLRNKFEAELASKQSEKRSLMEKMEELLDVTTPTTPDAEKIKLQYELKDCEKRLEEVCERLKRSEDELNAVKGELLKTRRKKNKIKGKIMRLMNDRGNILKKRVSIDAQIFRLLKERRRLQEAEEEHINKITSMKNRFTLINKDLDKLILDEENSNKILKEITNSYNNLKRRMGTLSKRRRMEIARKSRIMEKLTDLDKILAERRRMLEEIMNVVKILMDNFDSFRILFAKASGIMDYAAQDKKRREVLELIRDVSEKKGLGIYGFLRENIWFPKELNKAIESLAGDWMDAVLVRSPLDMLFLMNFLERMGIGVRILTSEGGMTKKEIPIELNGLGKHIMDVLKYPKSIEKHVSKLFWNGVVTDTIEDALIFARNGFRAVTINGEVFTAEGGLIVENSREELESIKNIVKSFSEKASGLYEMLEIVNNRVKPILNSKIFEASSIRSKLSQDLSIIDYRIKELEEQLSNLTSEYLEVSRRLSQAFRRRDMSRRHSLERERRKLMSLISAKEKSVSRIRRRIKFIEKELIRLEKRRNAIKNGLTSIENITNSLYKKIEGYKDSERVLKDKIAKAREGIRIFLDQINDLKTKMNDLKRRMEDSEVAHRKAEDKRRELVMDIQKLDREIEELNEKINRIKDIERRLLVKKEMDEIAIQDLKSRISGQPLKVSEDEEGLTENYLKILRSELDKVQEVNMLAIDQYEQEVYFYKNALEKINELEEERRSIQEFMEDIERRKREAFLDGLNKINEYFSIFFNKMTGGEGWLQLEDPERPFETGLVVYVRFPGKEARVISGVSGGEKSVAALCLIFAMQKLFPAAFYIFDEPDAHLDYVNVERMIDLLKEVSKESQMIIVSLRDIVVSRADKVIGVYVKNGSSKFIEMPSGKAMEEKTVVG